MLRWIITKKDADMLIGNRQGSKKNRKFCKLLQNLLDAVFDKNNFKNYICSEIKKCIQWFVHLLKFSRILEQVGGVESFEISSGHDAHNSMFYLYNGRRVLDLCFPNSRLFVSYLFDDAVANKPYLMKIWFCLLCHNYTDKPTGES